jgi:hypothetical protein
VKATKSGKAIKAGKAVAPVAAVAPRQRGGKTGVAKAISEGKLNAAQDTLGLAHEQGVESGNMMRAAAASGLAGKAQAIIKNRRV